ncbi:BMP family lipoprotein [Nakamurella leprariae]|uniref:BMP family ABC transporter substrate-binding protein n=1 Tax=Nakamurella leprariae TaxID=2803911 RepID=A0A939BY81_9ACTN|nr:BMP family ABC transporter substrate-binding protein [Nakamurella leprariae]MBM9469298.1 BMP family ABC transporter substrate-binding protein [Nakamurella leprariae]
MSRTSLRPTHRRALRGTAAAAALSATLLLAACGGSSDAGSTGSSSDSAASSGSSSSGEPFKVVVLSDGAANDQSWSNSVADGLNEIDPSLDVESDFVGPLTTADEYQQQGSSYASNGFDMILITNGGQTSAAVQIAEQFPDVTVCQGPISPTEDDLASFPSNFCAWNLKQQDGTFLAGVVAGLVTQTDVIGSVAGGEFPAVVRQPEGFILGARCVNPDVTIDIQYTGSFSDVGAAQAAAQTEIAGGADVLLSAVDSAVRGLYAAAEGAPRPTFVIPSYFDSYEQAPETVLTSVLYNLNGITADLIAKGAQGELGDADGGDEQYFNYDYANLNVGELADFHGNAAITPEIEAKLAEIEGKLRDGTITVPGEDGADMPLSENGAGSTIDPASIGC